MKDDYKPTIGLEIHAELKTKSKMFCGCENAPHTSEPNSRICPICMAHPGTLPKINKEAVKNVLKVGVALNGNLADFTEFDRKNYFYPDIPKGYQISQYEYPLVTGGRLCEVDITRIHLEEDTAKSTHDKGDYSLVDYNRAGVPLMELVTEPVIKSGKKAADFARELQLLLRTLDISEANMERGEMRVEANISVSKSEDFGTKTEVKNLNSFRSVEKAIAFEIERQIEILENGETVEQETRGWDENKQETYTQRKKESSQDYRYFPEPDLPKLKISQLEEFSKNSLLSEIPELPNEKRKRLIDLGIKEEDVETLILDFQLGDFFDEVSNLLNGSAAKLKLAANYITSDLQGIRSNDSEIQLPRAELFVELINMIDSGELSSRGAKDTLVLLFDKDESPKKLAEEANLLQQSDESALEKVVEEVIAENPEVVTDYKSGNENVFQFFIGQGMKKTKGSANPQVLAEIFKKKLK
ncbi:MAG: Asp-tRNA(Asn)/Glu-tRNA(Gln) amidotransferase subunit GatB [Candidatus Campbellbacteria bacterium]|nr:Asp-tRNA(Asn)/Glu-tRNA(Gln) amidotransferase subunit GatB [Candidatus Campbellbacteria bacterium]